MGKSLAEMSAEIRARQDAHRAKLMSRDDALSRYQRRWHREHYYRVRRQHMDARSADLLIEAQRAQQRQNDYEEIKASAHGELRDLIDAQEKDDRSGHRVGQLRFIVSLEERISPNGLKLHERISA